MNQRKHKIFRFTHTDYGKMWDKEATIIEQIRSGELDQCMLLYQCAEPTLVLPSGRKWQATDEVKTALNQSGWQLFSRRSGGAPVPQTSGVINLSHFYLWPDDRNYSVKLAYENLCHVLSLFFAQFGVRTDAHATPNSFCDGDYNLNIAGRKIVGTAQRVLSVRKGRKLVLAQACLLIDDDMERLVKPVNLVNKLHDYEQNILPSVHTCLAEHIADVPKTDALYSALFQAFVKSGLYA
jgi:lipoate-protein ligase A